MSPVTRLEDRRGVGARTSTGVHTPVFKMSPPTRLLAYFASRPTTSTTTCPVGIEDLEAPRFFLEKDALVDEEFPRAVFEDGSLA